MLGDDRFQRTFLAQRRGVLRAQPVQIGLGFGFFATSSARSARRSLADFLGRAADPLADTFQIPAQLPALSAEGFHL